MREILAPKLKSPPAPCGALGRSLGFSELQFLHPQNEHDGNIFPTNSYYRVNKINKMVYLKVKGKM